MIRHAGLIRDRSSPREPAGPIDAPVRPRYREVVVGIDFGRGGLAAVDLARRLTVRAGRMTLVHVVLVGDEVAWRSDAGEVLAAQARSMWLLDRERRITLACDPAPECTVRTRSVVAGSAGRGLAHVAQALHADLVVLGHTHRHHWRPELPEVLLRGPWTIALAAPDGTGIFR